MEPLSLTARQARRLWIAAQRLDVEAPFGKGPAAVAQAVKHLGYVQIDTINVIERCHHHILFNRIPDYRRGDLRAAQSIDKSVFEAYVSAAKRKLGYFTLPVLIGDEIVAGLDLKTDRAAGKLLIQAWHWFGAGKPRTHRKAIEQALDRFETFQLAE